MNTGTFVKSIKDNNFDKFKNEFLKQKLSVIDKQKLLIVILENLTKNNQYSFYKKIFDLVIDSKINLNFISNDFYSKPFLFIAVNFFPQIQLFEYFIDKGAKINFFHIKFDEAETCLDFIQKYIEDTLVDDLADGYYYKVAKDYSKISNDNICVGKEDYVQLILQSELLYNLRDLTILKNHIIATGGKTYQELQNK